MSQHSAEIDAAEVRALASRARDSARIYAYRGAPAIAFAALADDLDALAASMFARCTPPGHDAPEAPR